MTASASDVIQDMNELKEWCRAGVRYTSINRGTSEVLLWILIRDEAEKQLELLQNETHSDTDA